MNWIERLFGISPDAGSGSLECLFFLICAIGAATVWRARRRAKKDLETR